MYTLYVKTGSIFKGGTDSIIRLSMYNGNLETWGGIMGRGYDYFERGNMDIFSGRAPCLGGPVCDMHLASDGSGSHHAWSPPTLRATDFHLPAVARHRYAAV